MKNILAGALFAGLALGFVFSGLPAKASQLPEPEEERTWEQTFIESNIAISKWFDGVADGLDLFLVGRRVTNRVNQSSLRIENLMVSQEGKKIANSISIGVNPRLPNLEEYWHLKFATYDERAEKRSRQTDYLRQGPRETNYGATVGVFRRIGDVRATFEPRIELRDPLSISHSLGFETMVEFTTFELNPKLEFWATPTKGIGTFQALNFHFPLNKGWSLTWINQGDYQEKLHLYSVTNGLSLGQVLTRDSALSYNIFFGSNNQPSYHLESYNLGVTYSQILYRKILDFQVTPNLDFQRVRNFKQLAGITFAVNLNF